MAYELAQALFDNFGDDVAGDELRFRKGEIVTVIEKNYQNMDGWWLCSLRGRTAIAPGNYFGLLSPEQQSVVLTTLNDNNKQQRSGSGPLPSDDKTYDTPMKKKVGYSATLPFGMKMGSHPEYRRAEAEYNSARDRSKSSTDDEGGMYDVPSTLRRPRVVSAADVDPPYTEPEFSDGEGDVEPKEMAISATAALKRLGHIQQKQIDPSVRKLNGSVTKHWLKAETLPERVKTLVPIGEEIKTALRDLDRFCFNLSVNAEKATDPNLKGKLEKLRLPVDETRLAIRRVLKRLRKEDAEVSLIQDNLQDLVTASMRLPQDVRELVVFVRGNSSLLFKTQTDENDSPDRPRADSSEVMSTTSLMSTGNASFFRSGLDSSSLSASMDSISDVSMSSKRDSIAEQPPIAASSPKSVSRGVKTLSPEPDQEDLPPPPPPARKSSGSLRERALSDITISPGQLTTPEKALLSYYSVHMQTMFPELTQSVQLLCASAKGEPSEFVPKAKFVIVCAYKLVYIADALFQKIVHVQLRNHVVHCSNKLSDAIKQVVDFTKRAALDYPSKHAVQKMVESISLVPEAARTLADSIKEGSEM
eukprot:m.6416 g.6416  ORF g.6416 m.6416 type:complete len:588 (+) comp15825_c0_seq1:2252-4015(+)